jgi:sensor domain CHASE-containing protein
MRRNGQTTVEYMLIVAVIVVVVSVLSEGLKNRREVEQLRKEVPAPTRELQALRR